ALPIFGCFWSAFSDNALLPEPTVARQGAWDVLGRPALLAAAVPLHHGAHGGGGGDSVVVELVAGAQGDFVVETIKIWTGLRRQSRGGRRPGGARPEQKRNANH